MRSLLAAVALSLATLVATAAGVAYAAHETVLAPRRAGDVLAAALQQPALRTRILSSAIPGYTQLPEAARELVDRAAQTPQVEHAVERLRMDRHGRVSLAPLQRQVVGTLRSHGQPAIAAALASVVPASVQLPARIVKPYHEARRTTWWVATRGALAAVGLVALAFLVSPHRRRMVGALGLAVLVACGLVALVWTQLPGLVATFSDNPWVDAAAGAGVTSLSSLRPYLVPAAVAGGALVVLSLALPRRR